MKAMRSIAGRSAVLRGGYASKRFRDRCETYSRGAVASPEAADSGAASSEPFAAYFLYLCTRKLRLIRFADAIDAKGLEMYMEYASRVLLEMIGPGGWGTATHTSRAVATVTVGGDTMTAEPSDVFVLGREGRSEINRSMILGETVSERIPRLDIELTIGLTEWEMLEARDEALDMLMRAVDLAVPVHMNYKIFFMIHSDEGVFTLPQRAGKHIETASLPMLGINSILGGA